MLKSFFDAFKSLTSIADDTKKNKEDTKTLRSDLEATDNDVRQIAWEAVADRRIAAEQQRTAERDRQILLMQIKEMLKDSEHRTLPPGSNSQDQIAAILARLEAMEKRIEALENAAPKM